MIPENPARSAPPSWSARHVLLLLLFGGYLLLPILTSTHVELMSAQILINAIASGENRLEYANLLYPIHTEYFYITRVGTVKALEYIARVVGTGDIAFRILIVTSFAAYVTASLCAARRHSTISVKAMLTAMLLTPGIAELGFSFNDNVGSAAAGMIALALLPPAGLRGRDPLYAIRAAAAGIALGLAIFMRIDAIFLLPVVFGMTVLNDPRPAIVARTSAIGLAALSATLVAAYGAVGVRLDDAIALSAFFDSFPHREIPAMIGVAILFLGLPNLILLPMGIKAEASRSDRLHKLVLIGLPAVYIVYFALHSMETRHLYPLLAPFVAIHGGSGVERLWADFAQPGRRRAARLKLATIAAILLAPPLYVPLKDGPRAILGRAWSPILWRRWQAQTNRTLANMALPIDSADARRSTVDIALHYDADAYTRLRLWQRGYRPERLRAPTAGCRGGFEVWRAGDRHLFLVRTGNPHFMAPEPHDYVEALQLQQALPCPLLRNPANRIFVSGQRMDKSRSLLVQYERDTFGAIHPPRISYAWPPLLIRRDGSAINWRLDMFSTSSLEQRAMEIGRQQLAGLEQKARDEVARNLSQSPGKMRDYDRLLGDFGYHFWRPTPRGIFR
ncbi:MAG: hypothetical protein JWR77_1129 [Rhizorhabdus sp.]|nr:hypothetical protein [Rhizorhabdus sp.]